MPTDEYLSPVVPACIYICTKLSAPYIRSVGSLPQRPRHLAKSGAISQARAWRRLGGLQDLAVSPSLPGDFAQQNRDRSVAGGSGNVEGRVGTARGRAEIREKGTPSFRGSYLFPNHGSPLCN